MSVFRSFFVLLLFIGCNLWFSPFSNTVRFSFRCTKCVAFEWFAKLEMFLFFKCSASLNHEFFSSDSLLLQLYFVHKHTSQFCNWIFRIYFMRKIGFCCRECGTFFFCLFYSFVFTHYSCRPLHCRCLFFFLSLCWFYFLTRSFDSWFVHIQHL